MSTSKQIYIIAFSVIAIIALVFIAKSPTQYAFFSSSTRPSHCMIETYDTKPNIQENSLTTISFENGKYVVKKCIGDFVFKNLPPFPENFIKIQREICYQRIEDLSFYDKVGVDIGKYYIQPEIIGAADCTFLFDETGLQFYAGYEENQPVKIDYPGQIGYGAYPALFYRKIEKGGGKVNVTTFFHSSWGIMTYQGFNLVAIYPSNGNFKGQSLEQNPDTVKNYINAKVLNNEFVLEPTWPIFSSNWTRRVDIVLDVSPDTPPGKYYIAIIPGPISKEKQYEYMLAYYWSNFIFVGSSSFSVIGEPPIQILIEIE